MIKSHMPLGYLIFTYLKANCEKLSHVFVFNPLMPGDLLKKDLSGSVIF